MKSRVRLHGNSVKELPSVLTVVSAGFLHLAALVVLTGHVVAPELGIALVIWLIGVWVAQATVRSRSRRPTKLTSVGAALPIASVCLAVFSAHSWGFVCAAILQLALIMYALPANNDWTEPQVPFL